jgi:hypothetical protein
MDIRVLQGDALEFAADVLVLKYAQHTYGVDELVIARLDAAGNAVQNKLPKSGDFKLINTAGQLAATCVLFVGVVELRAFGYEAIREFSKRALSSLAITSVSRGHENTLSTSHIAFTLHGAGYGLDESEAFRAELAGILDSVETGDCPPGIEVVTFVERNQGRARRLQKLLDSILATPTSKSALKQAEVSFDRMPAAVERTITTGQIERLRSAGAKSMAKPHIFVAMPFAPEFDDLFHYGIYQSVHASGCLCERADLATFTGDVIAWVKERIDSARLLVADLSTANPNVYLEFGYAWGRGIPTVLVARDTAGLGFDVKGQRCLVYNNSIKKLEDSLTKELKSLLG